jgi:hypothetical protein
MGTCRPSAYRSGGGCANRRGVPDTLDAVAPETAELIGAFGGVATAALVAVSVAYLQRHFDRNADTARRDREASDARRATEAIAVGELAAAVVELRLTASGVVDDDHRQDAVRRMAPLLGRMVSAQTRIYAVSDDEHLIGLARGVALTGMDLVTTARTQPFDPARYEGLRSILERTFRALRQHHRTLTQLPGLENDPTNETSDDYEGEGDPVIL